MRRSAVEERAPASPLVPRKASRRDNSALVDRARRADPPTQEVICLLIALRSLRLVVAFSFPLSLSSLPARENGQLQHFLSAES